VSATAWLTWSRQEQVGLVSMVAIGVSTVLSSQSRSHQIGGAIALAVAELALVAAARMGARGAGAAILISVTVSMVAVLLLPKGFAEIPVLVAASRIPRFIRPSARLAMEIVFSIAFGLVIARITNSIGGLAAGFGVYFFAQRTIQQDELAAERDRAVRLLKEIEASRDADARAAALEERGRIARDMHDVLAHSLAGLSLQLQAVRAVAASEGVSASVMAPLDQAAELARCGVSEARGVVGALRAGPSLGIHDLPAMVARFPGHADYLVVGEAGVVTQAAGHAVYRAVQEALTNAARYAAGAEVGVLVRWETATLLVRVSNGEAPTVASVGSGLGLAGMTERIQAVGGHLHAGPHAGGWTVEMSVPTGD
jgi:signal transduction histidine kinase